MSTVNGFQVGSEVLKYNYESLQNYNTPNFSSSSSKAYAIGDYVMYNGKLYKCTTATTGGTWDANNWAEAILSDDVTEQKNAFNVVEELTVSEKYTPLGFTVNAGHLITDNGTISNASGQDISSLISVTAGKVYKITAGSNWSNAAYAFYSSNEPSQSTCLYVRKTSSSSGSAGYVVVNELATAPENAAYLILSRVGNKEMSVSEADGNENIMQNDIDGLKMMYPNELHFYSSGNDFSITDKATGIRLTASFHGSQNGGLNFAQYVKSDGTEYKTASDDICPVVYDGEYRCGNHGPNAVYALTSASHGLTEASIGKVFVSANNISYVLIKVPDENTLWILPDIQNYPFGTTAPTSPITNDGNSYAFTSATLTQLHPSINNIVQKVFINGAEISDVYNGDCHEVAISETYHSIDEIKMLAVLKANVGSNTNESYYADTLEGDLIYKTGYKVSKGLCMVIAANVITLRSMNLGDIGFVQSQSIGTRHYVPYSTETGILTTKDIVYLPATWLDQNFPPNKFYQFHATNNSVGFALAYNPVWGDSAAEVRKDCLSAGRLSAVNKFYPSTYYHGSPNNVPALFSVNGYAIRTPVSIVNNVIEFDYQIGTDCYAEIDTLATGLYNVPVGRGLEGKRITVIHKTDGIELLTSVVVGQIITVSGKGSMTLKVS